MNEKGLNSNEFLKMEIFKIFRGGVIIRLLLYNLELAESPFNKNKIINFNNYNLIIIIIKYNI